uniref:Nucleolar protein 8 n=1 Tax=Meleagris gallopavo TaxID=9103 RepID=A0A803YJ31_MELGA
MEKKKVSKRLYVGGLGHTVSKAELQERFGKFGRVLDVEIITRKDEQGNPTKTFAYITVSSSESDLRKCISILNKTKWGGRTLQIEFAKESFLHSPLFNGMLSQHSSSLPLEFSLQRLEFYLLKESCCFYSL